MKIRKGFVSNSSSSSFVVAFPKEPKSFDDVYEAMFNSKEGGISIYDQDGMSHSQIAQRVWKDIKSGTDYEYSGYGRRIKVGQDEIAEELSHRYNYWSKDSCVVSWGSTTDELGGHWSVPVGKYHGSDKDTLIKLRDIIIATEKKEREIRQRQHEIMKTEFKGRKAPYAYKGRKNHDTGEPYTQEEIDAYEAYCHEKEEFQKNHKEYQDLEKAEIKSWDIKYSKQEELRKKLAKADAREFMSDNKDAFFVVLSYSDNDGWPDEGTLEHGDIFRNLPFIRISHH
jgi:hypothetical protein